MHILFLPPRRHVSVVDSFLTTSLSAQPAMPPGDTVTVYVNFADPSNQEQEMNTFAFQVNLSSTVDHLLHQVEVYCQRRRSGRPDTDADDDDDDYYLVSYGLYLQNVFLDDGRMLNDYGDILQYSGRTLNDYNIRADYLLNYWVPRELHE
eukprot:8872740-Heterocapsa_arctica.AAC.1